MKFGPFTMSAARRITDALTESGVPFEASHDDDTLALEEGRWKGEAARPIDRRGPSYDPAFIFLSVPDELLREPSPLLAELGLVVSGDEPDFSREEYVCPSCARVVSQEAGFCGRHRIPLLPWSEHVSRKRERKLSADSTGSRITRFLLGAIGALGAGLLLLKLTGRLG